MTKHFPSWRMLGLAALTLAPLAVQAQAQRNEIAFQWAPAPLSNDDRRVRALAYDRDMGNGWALGGTLGYGDMLRRDGKDGAYGVVRVRYRLPPMNRATWVQPQVGLEYGGASNFFSNAELWGMYAGAYLAASDQLGFTVDYWMGRARDKASGSDPAEKRSVRHLRLGISVKY